MKKDNKTIIIVISIIVLSFYFGFIAGNIAMKHKVEQYIEINR